MTPTDTILSALESLTRQLDKISEGDTTTTVVLKQRHAHTLLKAFMTGRLAIVDNRGGLGLNAEKESDFPDLYKLVGKRVLLVDFSGESL